MRVSTITRYSTVLREVQANQRTLDAMLVRIATGQKVQRAHEDPVLARRLVAMRTTLEQNEQYQRNAADARNWLDTTDTALGQAGDYLSRARDLAVQAASGTLDVNQAVAIATEINEIIRALRDVGNANLAGRYIFAGHRTDSPPLVLTGDPPSAVTFGGDSGKIAYEIAQGVSLQVNATGDTFFTGLIADLITLRDQVLARDLDGVAASLKALDGWQDTLLAERAAVGGKSSAVEFALRRLGDEAFTLTVQMSDEGGVDLAEASVQLASAESAHRAALAAASKVVLLSLVDFLK